MESRGVANANQLTDALFWFRPFAARETSSSTPSARQNASCSKRARESDTTCATVACRSQNHRKRRTGEKHLAGKHRTPQILSQAESLPNFCVSSKITTLSVAKTWIKSVKKIPMYRILNTVIPLK